MSNRTGKNPKKPMQEILKSKQRQQKKDSYDPEEQNQNSFAPDRGSDLEIQKSNEYKLEFPENIKQHAKRNQIEHFVDFGGSMQESIMCSEGPQDRFWEEEKQAQSQNDSNYYLNLSKPASQYEQMESEYLFGNNRDQIGSNESFTAKRKQNESQIDSRLQQLAPKQERQTAESRANDARERDQQAILRSQRPLSYQNATKGQDQKYEIDLLNDQQLFSPGHLKDQNNQLPINLKESQQNFQASGSKGQPSKQNASIGNKIVEDQKKSVYLYAKQEGYRDSEMPSRLRGEDSFYQNNKGEQILPESEKVSEQQSFTKEQDCRFASISMTNELKNELQTDPNKFIFSFYCYFSQFPQTLKKLYIDIKGHFSAWFSKD